MFLNLQNLKLNLKSFLQTEFRKLQPKTSLNIIQIGNDLASQKYIQIKSKVAKDLNIQINHYQFLANGKYLYNQESKKWLNFEKGVEFDEFRCLALEKFLNQNILYKLKPTDGLIFQLPVPNYLQKFISNHPIWQTVCDLDFLALETNYLWQKNLLPPTIQAIDLVLKQIFYDKENKKIKKIEDLFKSRLNLAQQNVCVLGQGQMVGRPLLNYLVSRQATIFSINEFSSKVKEILALSDVVISAVGKPKLVDPKDLKKQSIFIDVATSEANGVLVGDLDYDKLKILTKETTDRVDNLSLDIPNLTICPSPRGVGPLTVLSLFYNFLILQKLKLNLL